MAVDGKYATVNFLDPTGKVIATETAYAPDGVVFADPNQVFDQLRIMVDTDAYSGDSKRQILTLLTNPMQMTETGQLSFMDYALRYKDAWTLGDFPAFPSLVDATGEVIGQGKAQSGQRQRTVLGVTLDSEERKIISR